MSSKYLDAATVVAAPITFNPNVGNIDLAKNPVINFVLPVSSTPPSNPVAGIAYFNSVLGKIGIYSGSAWIYFGIGDVIKSDYFDGSGDLLISALPAHASTHKSGGADALRINELSAPNGSLAMNGYTISGVAQAVNDTDVPNLAQVKAYFAGVKWKQDVVSVATSNITLSGTQTVNGIQVSSGRVLCTAQTNAYQNLIYDVNSSGAWTPASDSDSITELLGAHVEVTAGSFAGTEWRCKVASTATYGTSSIPWSKIEVGVVTADANGALTINGGVAKVNVDDYTLEIVNNLLQVKTAFRKFDNVYSLPATAANTEIAIANPNNSLNCAVKVLDASGNERGPAIRKTTSYIYITFAFAITAGQYTAYVKF